MKPVTLPTEDQTTMTEITIQPDGRVYVFGTSREVLAILAELDPESPKIRLLMDRVLQVEADGPAGKNGATDSTSLRQS